MYSFWYSVGSTGSLYMYVCGHQCQVAWIQRKSARKDTLKRRQPRSTLARLTTGVVSRSSKTLSITPLFIPCVRQDTVRRENRMRLADSQCFRRADASKSVCMRERLRVWHLEEFGHVLVPLRLPLPGRVVESVHLEDLDQHDICHEHSHSELRAPARSLDPARWEPTPRGRVIKIRREGGTRPAAPPLPVPRRRTARRPAGPARSRPHDHREAAFQRGAQSGVVSWSLRQSTTRIHPSASPVLVLHLPAHGCARCAGHPASPRTTDWPFVRPLQSLSHNQKSQNKNCLFASF